MKIRPSAIRLEASSHCQLRCPSCPTTTGAIDAALGKGFLRLNDFRTLVDATPFLREVELSNYGEIFLNPELLGILEYAHQKGVAVSVFNGANLNHVREEVLEALVRTGVRRLTCSIDGASQESYATYRVRGDFERVIGNVRRINAFKEQFNSPYPVLVWQFIVFGHNEHEIAAARAMAAELGMEFFLKLTWDDGFSPIRDREAVEKEIGSRALTRDEVRSATGKDYLGSICEQLWSSPQINWNGDVLGCCRNFWGSFGGNAFSEGVVPAVNSEGMRYARLMLEGRAEPRADIPCTTCELYLRRAEDRRWMHGPVERVGRLVHGLTARAKRLLGSR